MSRSRRATVVERPGHPEDKDRRRQVWPATGEESWLPEPRTRAQCGIGGEAWRLLWSGGLHARAQRGGVHEEQSIQERVHHRCHWCVGGSVQSTVTAGVILTQRRRNRWRSKPKLRLRRAPGESTMQTSEVTEANAIGPTEGRDASSGAGTVAAAERTWRAPSGSTARRSRRGVELQRVVEQRGLREVRVERA